MAEVAADVVEQILVRLDAEDLIRCKSVCKSWKSLISSPRFVKAHLNHSYSNDCNNYDYGHRRIAMPMKLDEARLHHGNYCHIIGSSNGLVCISPNDDQLLVTNPSTREVKKLQTPYPRDPPILFIRRTLLCWGFGYDSSIDDYKVVIGTYKGIGCTHFRVLTLKSNVWKDIGEVNYRCIGGVSGILCDGALHWFMCCENNMKEVKVILSLDLSREEFKEIPQPDALLLDEFSSVFSAEAYRLGVVQECLCVYDRLSSSSKRWVMKNYNVKESWEPLMCDVKMKYDAIHYLRIQGENIMEPSMFLSMTCDYVFARIFVRSLVSPHVNNERRRQTKIIKSAKEARSFLFLHSILKRKRKRQPKNSKRNSKGLMLLTYKKQKKNEKQNKVMRALNQ